MLLGRREERVDETTFRFGTDGCDTHKSEVT